MKQKKLILLTSIFLLFTVFSSGCGDSKEVEVENPNKNIASTEKKVSSIDDKKGTERKIVKTSIKDIIGTWEGEIGKFSIYLAEGKRGEINFPDNHGNVDLFFDGYKNKGNALQFEINPSTSGYENQTKFSITIQHFSDDSIDISIGNGTKSFSRITEKEYSANINQEKYQGSMNDKATEENLNNLEKDLQSLSDSRVQIGTLSNFFDGTNRVSTYLNYIGNDDEIENIRATILNKVVEMNKVVDNYGWVDDFTINSYLNKGVPGETEKDKQTNGLTNERVHNQGNLAYQVTTIPNDRWILSKTKVKTSDIAGYVYRFGSNGPFLLEKDKERTIKYPFYGEKLDGLTVLKAVFTEGN